MFTIKSVKETAIRILNSIMTAGILCVSGDIAIAWQGHDVSCTLFLLVFVLVSCLCSFLLSMKKNNAMKLVVGLLYLYAILVGTMMLCWKLFSVEAVFENVDQGKKQLYSEKKVMLIVPHQDDDINVLGGVMEEYVRYGSEMYPVFVTNGDYHGLAEERIQEALNVMNYIGVPEENVIFLGYGDSWQQGGPHIYNAQPGVIMKSHAGYSATYGTDVHEAYRTGRDYTIENYLQDLKDVILEKRPDVIFCSDYDNHVDHKSLTLAFEKVMGNILKEYPDYRPLVFKGYAYTSAWFAEPDFYKINILSTRNVFDEPHYQSPAVYRWEDRVRLPVGDYTLSRSLVSSRGFETLTMYKSQDADFNGSKIINGDKVFWFRDVNSLCYQADIRVSSGDGSLLNDFMLLENTDILDEDRRPCDGTWIPVDEEKSAAVTFPESVALSQIRIYDNPSSKDNVLGGKIQFPDGSEIAFGPLDPYGSALVIPVDRADVSGFVLVLTETEGENAGITELEAFSNIPEHGMRYVKFMDSRDNFTYDYWISTGVDTQLKVYTCGLTDAEQQNLRLSSDNLNCNFQFENGEVQVICPKGEYMTLTVSVEGTDLSDTIRVHNPRKMERLLYVFGQKLEEQMFLKYCDCIYDRSATMKLTNDFKQILS